jgi:hypothetical protein
MPHLMVSAGVQACEDETFELNSMVPLSRDNREYSRTVSTTRLLELLVAIGPSKEHLTRQEPSRTWLYIAASFALEPQLSIETRLYILINPD